MRREPSDKSEMTNQILFGETMQLLDKNEKWYMVKLDHDGYEGWADKKQLKIIAENTPENISFADQLFVQIEKTGEQSIYIPAGALVGSGQSQNKEQLSSKPAEILKVAMMFLGAPYLWGGRTFMGMDCSGLTQIVMRICGIDLPRDAYQQAEIGEVVTFIDECLSGDLAFFDNADGKITHVGIIFEDEKKERKIIHASGQVRIDAIDHQGIYNHEIGEYTHQLRIIKRIS